MAKRTYTPDEYQSQFVDFYNYGGIDVNVAAAAGEEEKKEELPNVLTPVSARGGGGGGGSNPLTYSTIGGKSTFKTERIDPSEYIKKFANKQKVNFSDDGFQKYLEANAGSSIAGVMMGPLVGGVAYGAASLNRKRQLENARKIQAQGGGFMVEYNGQTISRAPGSRFYEGTLGGMTQDQFAAIEAIQKGFIPGTFRDNEAAPEDGGGYQPTGKAALYTGSTFAVDAYGNLHSASGIQGGRAFEAEEARQGFMRQELDRMGLRNVTFTDAQARDFITKFRSQAGAGRPFAGFNNTVRTMDDTAYAEKVSGSQETIQNILGDMGFTKKDDDSGAPPPVRDSAFDSNKPVGDLGFDDSDGDRYDSDPGGFNPADIATDVTEQFDFDDDFARGGRVGMQAGGAAQRPLPEAGFVAGPPENFTERETVADDQNGAVPEGTFVINAAAVEFAGSNDIRKMILDAYSTAREKGLDIGRVDRKLYEGTVDVALSKGEVVVPPDLAKIIGYDRLEKINNRGKKEVSRRQKKAGGGFLDGKKFAEGGEADYEDRIVTDEVRRKMKALVKSLPDDVDVQSVYYEPGYPAAQRYEDEEARLNETLPSRGRFFSRSQRIAPATGKRKRATDPKINVPMTPTLYNLAILAEEVAHQDALKYRQEYDPKKHKVGRRTFEKEQDYLEELRAKDFALSVVGGLFPKGDKTARGARASYEKDFAEHLALTDNRELVAAYVKKYPELNRFIKEVSYPEAKVASKTLPAGSFLTITDDNYYGQGQPKVNPDLNFLQAATREDITAQNEYHASFDYMFDKFKYLVAQLFVDAERPEYMQGYTASLPK